MQGKECAEILEVCGVEEPWI